MAFGNNEFPKTYSVPFISEESVDDAITAIYALLQTSAFRPEITLISKKPTSFRDSLRYSINPVLMTVSRNSSDSFEHFRDEYKKHRAGITAVVSLDKKDKLRVNISLPPEDAAEKAGIATTPELTVYDKNTDELMQDFFIDWEKQYNELKNSISAE